MRWKCSREMKRRKINSAKWIKFHNRLIWFNPFFLVRTSVWFHSLPPPPPPPAQPTSFSVLLPYLVVSLDARHGFCPHLYFFCILSIFRSNWICSVCLTRDFTSNNLKSPTFQMQSFFCCRCRCCCRRCSSIQNQHIISMTHIDILQRVWSMGTLECGMQKNLLSLHRRWVGGGPGTPTRLVPFCNAFKWTS